MCSFNANVVICIGLIAARRPETATFCTQLEKLCIFRKRYEQEKKDHIVKISFFTAVYKSMLMHSRINFCQEILYYWQHCTVAPPKMHWKKKHKEKKNEEELGNLDEEEKGNFLSVVSLNLTHT